MRRARVFGFKAAIAHGMWTTARCLAALQSRLPEAFSVGVACKEPILLPASVEFCELEGDENAFSVSFSVRDPPAGSSHVELASASVD